MLKPFMAFLRSLGAPVAREVLRADLPQWGFEDCDVLVPLCAQRRVLLRHQFDQVPGDGDQIVDSFRRVHG